MDQVCMVCGSVGFNEGDDGYYYCGNCDTQAEDLINACTDEADLFKDMGMYSQRRARPTPAKPEYHPHSQQFGMPENDVKFGDGIGPTGPSDFGSCPMNGSDEDYYRAIRWKYVLGFQIMLQLQTKALIQHFNVSPNIIDLHNPIWLRLLAHTRVMADQWADNVLDESEVNKPGKVTESQCSARHREEPQNIFGQRVVMICHRSLRRCLPISYTLALSFLFCHVAEEPILPTDILKGVLEGKIPYFTAFVDIEKQLGDNQSGPPTRATILCPISCSVMFRPTRLISLQKLEAVAASIAEKIGLELRPLNFKTLATRYIKELSLPVPKILPLASRIYECSMPHGICLSANELKPPSRVFLMSILVVATRVYYNINGFGKWESTMSKSSSSLPRGKLNGKENNTFGFDLGSDAQEEDFVPNISSKDYEVHESDVGELLHILDEKFNKLCELHDNFAHYKDLPSYLQFCKDGVFAGVKPSLETCEEEKLIEEVWEFYQKDSKSSKNGINRPGEDEVCTPAGCKTPQGDGNACDTCKNAHNEGATRSIKRDMEDNKFVYVPPRSKVQRDDHIYYCRKKNDGAYIFAVHGDYYILLRSCAKVCQVDVRTMHYAVLIFERGLQEWEKEQVASEV